MYDFTTEELPRLAYGTTGWARPPRQATRLAFPTPGHEWQLVLMQDGEPAYWNRQRYVPAGRPRPPMEMIELVLLARFGRRWHRGDVMRYYPIR